MRKIKFPSLFAFAFLTLGCPDEAPKAEDVEAEKDKKDDEAAEVPKTGPKADAAKAKTDE